jgi:hypothetical protein
MRRLATTAALAALALAAPALALAAPAQAQSLEDTCASVEVVPGACVGISKVTERAAAECRRAGVPDESCIAPMARRVMRGEVRAHASSWLHRTLDYQYELGSSLPLRDAPWIGTHNSFNSTSEFPTVSHTDSNQQLSLTHQLRIDVRSLELDVHWLPSPHAGGQPAPVVCHGRGRDQLHTGCTTERLLRDTIDEVATWLRDHDDQVLLLYVEDAVDTPEGYDPTAAVLEQGLRDERGRSLVYRPPSGGACADLPLELTRDRVRKAGAQVVMVTSGCGEGAAWRGLVFYWRNVEVEGRAHGYRDAPVCDQDPDGDGAPEFGRDVYASKLVRYYEDSTWISRAAEPTGLGSPDDGLTPATVGRMSRCGVELLGFDQILPRDGRLAALAWSWAEDEPSRAGDCAIQRGDGRWVSRRCTKRHRAACRRPDGRWVLTSAALPADPAARACAQRGGVASAPRTAAENEALRQAARAANADGVWLTGVR